MGEFILQLGIMSLQAGLVIGVVLVVRQLFAGMHVPKKYMNVLWMLPYLCMVCPWKFEGDWGFWRKPRTYQFRRIEQIVAQTKALQSGSAEITAEGNSNFAHTAMGDTALGNALENIVQNTGEVSGGYVSNADIAALVLEICASLWILGVAGICAYTIWSYVKLRREILCSVEIAENVYVADDIKVPFVLGIFKPRIYLPSDINGAALEYVVAHERTHITRKDPLKKMIAFWITCLHWFNPLAWIAFHYLEKDMEMACDEETVSSLGLERKKDYANALLALSAGKRLFLGAPLAFGEGNVKSRICNIVKYKKALGIVSVLAVVLIGVLAIGFMTKGTEYVALSEVDDHVVIPQQKTSIRIVSGGEVLVLPAEYCYDEVAEFLGNLMVESRSADFSRSEERSAWLIMELGDVKFHFSENCETVWCDNGVKPSYSYRLEDPASVSPFLKQVSEAEEARAQGEIQQEEEVQKAHEELASQRELTMEELIQLCKDGTIGEVMQAQATAVPEYSNLEYSVPADMNALNWNYFWTTTYNGSEYRMQVMYAKPESANISGWEENELQSVILMNRDSSDMILLYDNEPDRYVVNPDIEEFLGREYRLDLYMTLDLPEGTWLSSYQVDMNGRIEGSLILGEYEEVPHAEHVLASWYGLGGAGLMPNDDLTFIFENGRLAEVFGYSNHAFWAEHGEVIDGCEKPAVLFEYECDLFTAAEYMEYMEANNLEEGTISISAKHWYIFLGEETDECLYVVFLNQQYFTKEDVVELARSIKFVE